MTALECQKCHLAWLLPDPPALWVTSAATPPDCNHEEAQ